MFDSNGRAYLDASGGAAVSPSATAIRINAAACADRQLAYTHSSFFTTDVAERLADKLVEDAPKGSHRLFRQRRLGGCRSVAEDGAAVFCREGQAKRTKVIARRQSYHGNTLGALATGGNELRRTQFGRC